MEYDAYDKGFEDGSGGFEKDNPHEDGSEPILFAEYEEGFADGAGLSAECRNI